MLKYLEQSISETGADLCNEYCKAQEEKMKNSMVHYLMHATDIYDSFKPRPHCSNTAIGYSDESYYRSWTPDPIRGIAEFDCVNSIEVLFIATGVMMAVSFLVLIYHRKKVSKYSQCKYSHI